MRVALLVLNFSWKAHCSPSFFVQLWDVRCGNQCRFGVCQENINKYLRAENDFPQSMIAFSLNLANCRAACVRKRNHDSYGLITYSLTVAKRCSDRGLRSRELRQGWQRPVRSACCLLSLSKRRDDTVLPVVSHASCKTEAAASALIGLLCLQLAAADIRPLQRQSPFCCWKSNAMRGSGIIAHVDAACSAIKLDLRETGAQVMVRRKAK